MCAATLRRSTAPVGDEDGAGVLRATDASPASGLVVTDAELRMTQVVGSVFAPHDGAETKWPGRLISEIMPAEAWETLRPRYELALAGRGQSFHYHRGGDSRTYWVQITPLCGSDGKVTSLVVVLKDVTEDERLSAALDLSASRLEDAERMVGIGSWELDLAAGALSSSNGTRRVLGMAPGEDMDLAGFMAGIVPEDRGRVEAAIAKAFEDHGSVTCEFRFTRRDGEVRVLVAAGEVVSATDTRPALLRGATLDVTRQRESERAQAQATSLLDAGFDSAPIGMALSEGAEPRYVRVNDAMCTLLGRSRENLLTCRPIDITHPEDRAASAGALSSMLAAPSQSLQAEKRYLRGDGSSVWVELHATPVCRPDGSVWAFLSVVVDITARKETEARREDQVAEAVWLGRIRDALDHDRLVLYAQPIIDLRTGETVQQELLLRMLGEDGEIIAPGEFLPTAERYGLISEIDRWVVRQAVDLAAQGIPAEFNLSAKSIGDASVLAELESALAATGADPSLLVVEVTETAMMERLDIGRVFVERLKALGCQLALDDFGTGFASLTYLQHLPIDRLKIDIEFVRGLTGSEADERVVRGIVALAREFRHVTVAEGVEDEETLIRLRSLGVDHVQGYLLGRPAPLRRDRLPAKAARAGSANPVGVVRDCFAAFADRELDSFAQLVHADFALRPMGTAQRKARTEPYVGQAGIRTYYDDVDSVWDSLSIEPSGFREAGDAVIVFGQAVGESAGVTFRTDVIWVWRLRDGRAASVDVFPQQPE